MPQPLAILAIRTRTNGFPVIRSFRHLLLGLFSAFVLTVNQAVLLLHGWEHEHEREHHELATQSLPLPASHVPVVMHAEADDHGEHDVLHSTACATLSKNLSIVPDFPLTNIAVVARSTITEGPPMDVTQRRYRACTLHRLPTSQELHRSASRIPRSARLILHDNIDDLTGSLARMR